MTYSAPAASARNNAKKREEGKNEKKKQMEAEGETIPNAGSSCAYGGRRKEQKQKEEQTKETGS